MNMMKSWTWWIDHDKYTHGLSYSSSIQETPGYIGQGLKANQGLFFIHYFVFNIRFLFSFTSDMVDPLKSYMMGGSEYVLHTPLVTSSIVKIKSLKYMFGPPPPIANSLVIYHDPVITWPLPNYSKCSFNFLFVSVSFHFPSEGDLMLEILYLILIFHYY